ncbi:MAG: hypothetical protein KW793_03500, partial [Candidatus Doudnabacteria bacterium]|nr:hypothetical protein [Candidatus Doudnabacteria bacterium]
GEKRKQKMYAFHKKFTSSSNKIVLKYRTSEQDSSEETITWTSTTTFTYSASSVSYAIGDEVEITQGVGGGLCAHITDIHFTGSTTVQVTIDETFTNATGTGKARFQKWIKLLPTQTSTTAQNLETAIGKQSTWIQFKVFMIFKVADELEFLELVNKFNQPNQ